jgi:sodium-dependent phosphate cotransporter
MAGAGIISLERIFPMTLGANIGTTVTAILAGASGNVYGMAIAFSHLLFNIAGILIYYPVPQMRRIPLRLARWLGNMAARRRFYAIIYIVVIFFLIPAALIMIYRWLS